MTKPRYVFVHLPKTAGTSLNALLRAAFPDGSVSPPMTTVTMTAAEAVSLADYELVTGHLSGADLDRFLPHHRRFTVLREPVDRCLSLYSFLRGHTSHPLISLDRLTGRNDFVEATSLARQLDPADFFRYEHPALQQAIGNRMTWQIGDHARPECRQARSDRDAFELAARKLADYSYVGLAEQISRDVTGLLGAIGVSAALELPRENVTASRLRRGDLGRDALDAIHRVTECDRRLYDLVRRRIDAGDDVRHVA